MQPIRRTFFLTLPLIAAALLAPPRPAAAQYTTFVQQTGNATLNGQGVTGSFTAVYEGGARPTDTYFDDAVISGTSIFTLQNGGSLGQLSGGDSTTINIQGGSLPGGVAELGATNGLYTLNVSGGSVSGIDLASALGTATVSGGTVSFLQSYTASAVNITGGSVGLASGLYDGGGGVFTISGGKIGDFTVVSPGLNFFGSGLAYQNGHVTGLLTDGTAINSAVSSSGLIVVGDSHHLTFAAAPIPEASGAASFGLLLALGVGGLALAGRRRKALRQAS